MSASAAHVLQIARGRSPATTTSTAAPAPTRFDCSGFTQYVFCQGRHLAAALVRRAAVDGRQRVSSPQPGDLVFVYNGGGGSIGHVAIYAGGGYWYEASNPSTGVGKHRAWSSNVSYGRVL